MAWRRVDGPRFMLYGLDMGHKFPHENWERLVSEERRAWQDPARLLDVLGVGAGETWADVGCGPGFFTVPLARRVKKVYAVDVQAPMLGILRERLQEAGVGNVEIVLSGEHHIPLPDRTVDGVLLVNVFHEVQDGEAFFRELVRITRKRVVIVDWKREETPMGPPLEERLSEFAVHNFLVARGEVREVRSHDIYPHHYVLEAVLAAEPENGEGWGF